MNFTESDLVLTEDHFNVDNEIAIEELVSTSGQIESAIAKHIKVLRSQTISDEMKKKLVHKICELRIKLNQLNDINEQLYLSGHKLNKYEDITKSMSQLVCDQCLKRSKTKIFGLKKNENYLLVCQFCQFVIHRFCRNNNLLRKCPKLLFEEKGFTSESQNTRNVILKICPEVGLSRQEFRCAECKSLITNMNSRICDYSGLYFCYNCHFGQSDCTVIPARIIHNWDFTPKAVSRSSLQLINYIKRKPVLFNIMELNSMLYGLVEELAQIKRVRSELSQMSKYIRLCKQPMKPKISLNSYLLDESALNSYSLTDFCDLPQLFKSLSEAHNVFIDHIINDCEGCRGKGFFCELCQDKDDLLFPFSSNIANCPNCSAVYHKNCYYRRNKVCPRCERLKAKNNKSLN